MQENTEFLTELLNFLNPSMLNYQEWINVGMALKHEGFSFDVWNEWSKRDAPRYHEGECKVKWNSFVGNGITGGTLYELALSYGFTPKKSEGHALDWGDEIGKDDYRIVNANWLEGQEIAVPESFNPKSELIKYLSIFDSTENVGYVTETWEKDGKFMPTKGVSDRTAGELIEALTRCNDICDVIGDYNAKAGAWIRFNPLDGKGVKNENVTDFRYALVESDILELEKQNAVIRELELPVAMLVYSGGKSLHAIVKIEAANYEEYRKRVDYLYNVCQKKGLALDKQNRNPSRLSRMPGIERNGRKQYIVDSNIGKNSWSEWVEWIESVNDDLPDPEILSDVWESMPDLAPCLIDGILRQGHKLLLAGPSKAGKSFALIELSIAIAEGKSWLGNKCAKGRVIYINLELDRASCLHRFREVYKRLELPPENIENIDIWNLRGNTIPLDKLAPKLIRRAHKKDYIAVIIDPIYKVITGDENSAEQMSYFCNQFDKICAELGTSVIYCHHHSKGAQGTKRSMDRASGSGVFARDPDALLDLIELELPEKILKEESNKAVKKVCVKILNEYVPDFDTRIDTGDLYKEDKALETCMKLLSPEVYRRLCGEVNAAKKIAESKTAWRIEATLREFSKPSAINVWFDYPIHIEDKSGVLQDVQLENTNGSPWNKNFKNQKSPDERKEERGLELEKAFEAVISFSGKSEASIAELCEYMSKSEKSVRNHIKESEKYYIADGKVGKRS